MDQTPDSSPPIPVRLSALDGVRGLAILLVLLSHSIIYTQTTPYLELIPLGLAAGSAGVTIFFVLSGFLITGILLREKSKTGTIDFKRFYIRRAFRLWPALWLLLIVISMLGFLGLLKDCPWHSIVSSLLSLRNLIGRGHETSHLWSLSIEEQAYFLWPFLVLILTNHRKLLIFSLLVLILGTPLWRYIALEFLHVQNGTVYVRTDFRCDGLAVGALLAVLQERMSFRPTSNRIIALAGLVGLMFAIVSQSFGFVHQSIEYSIYATCGLATVQAARSNVSIATISSAPMVHLVRMSYSIYLWQQVFLGPVESLQQLRIMPIGLVLSLACGAASYFFIERPFNLLKDRVWT